MHFTAWALSLEMQELHHNQVKGFVTSKQEMLASLVLVL